MNPYLKKEIRLLLPGFSFASLLALTNLLFRFNPDGSLDGSGWYVLAFGLSAATVVMLALNSFGAEISSGTFANLLAQPISRQKIWETKIVVLAITLLLVGIIWAGCGLIRLAMLGRDLNLLDLVTGVGMMGLLVFSGGLWTVLLLRQVVAAFWITVLVPAVLLVLASALFGNEAFGTGMVICVLGAYSLAGLILARRLFFRAQDLQWSGGNIELPEWRGLARLKSAATGMRRHWRPRAALWRKELQLQQSQFVITLVLAGLHLGVLGVRKFYDLHNSRDLKFILEIFWGLWLVMPLLVGCTAVAEERKLGTLAGQLCLPVKQRTQFAIKFSVVLFLSVLLGMLAPLLLEGTRILPAIGHAPFALTGPKPGQEISTAQTIVLDFLQ